MTNREIVYVGYGSERCFAKVAAEIIHHSALQKFKAPDHALFAYLLHRARSSAGEAMVHSIPIRDAKNYLDCSRAKLLDSLNRLSSVNIEIDDKDENGKQPVCPFLDFELDDSTATLRYQFSGPLLRYMYDPKIFALLDLETLRRFRTVEAARLWEILTLEERKRAVNSRSVNLTQVQMHFRFGSFKQTRVVRDPLGKAPDKFQPAPWDQFRRHTLDGAVGEINRSADFFVYMEIKTDGRGGKVRSVTFWLQDKTSTDDMHAISGKYPTQEELEKRHIWIRGNETPRGGRRRRRRLPNSLSKISFLYQMSFDVSEWAIEEAAGIVAGTGLVVHELKDSWCAYLTNAGNERRKRRFNYDKSFLDYVRAHADNARTRAGQRRLRWLDIMTGPDPRIENTLESAIAEMTEGTEDETRAFHRMVLDGTRFPGDREVPDGSLARRKDSAKIEREIEKEDSAAWAESHKKKT
jgi:hypothetical protein